MSCGIVSSFGNAVRRARESRNWSQEQLAEHADLNRSYIGEIERGKVVASLLTVEKLGAAFDMAGSSLLQKAERNQAAQALKGIELVAIAC